MGIINVFPLPSNWEKVNERFLLITSHDLLIDTLGVPFCLYHNLNASTFISFSSKNIESIKLSIVAALPSKLEINLFALLNVWV